MVRQETGQTIMKTCRSWPHATGCILWQSPGVILPLVWPSTSPSTALDVSIKYEFWRVRCFFNGPTNLLESLLYFLFIVSEIAHNSHQVWCHSNDSLSQHVGICVTALSSILCTLFNLCVGAENIIVLAFQQLSLLLSTQSRKLQFLTFSNSSQQMITSIHIFRIVARTLCLQFVKWRKECHQFFFQRVTHCLQLFLVQNVTFL